jgi:exonuclease III
MRESARTIHGNEDPIWNIRGMGAIGRRKQLSDIRRDNRVDIICLQETIKGDFSLWDLESLSEGEPFEWVWTAAQGHSGGTLIGVRIKSVILIY